MSAPARALRRTSSEPFLARIPGSKSYTNRALVLAALRRGTTRVTGGLHADDTELLAAALDAFGGLEVERTDDGFVVRRGGEVLGAPERELDLGAAGTPARFLLAFATLAEGATVVTGNARLRERPMGDLLASLAALGMRHEALGTPGHLPVRIHGGPIAAREWTVPGGVSSQFTSALCLLASAQPRGPIRITVAGHRVSTPYVGMTLAMMSAAGVRCGREGETTLVVHPGEPTAETLPVEVDASGMSYFLAAAAVTGTTVEVPGIDAGSLQGDVRLVDAFAAMGCRVDTAPGRIRLTGAPLRGIDLDMESMPDVALTLAAVAARASGPTRLSGLANLRVKESDRIHAAVTELRRLGVRCEERADGLVVDPEPGQALAPARIRTYDDHRVAMSFAVLSLVADGLELEDPTCAAKSFPGFHAELARFRAHHEGP